MVKDNDMWYNKAWECFELNKFIGTTKDLHDHFVMEFNKENS